MSLVISITCAVLATLLQQWARRYLKVTQTRYSLDKRARIRSFFAEGVEKSLLPWAVEALPMLLHVSLVLFFAGLAVFLWNVNLTIFKAVLSWIGICTALYGCTMITSILHRDSPYYAPLTPLALPVISVIVLVLWIPWACYGVFAVCWTRFSGRELYFVFKVMDWFHDFLEPIFMTPTVAALNSSPDLDTRALMWTLDRLDEDHELVRFFSGVPGFHTSKAVKQPLRSLSDEQSLKLLTAIIGFLDRTVSSDLFSDRVKRQRADICEKAIDLLDTPEALLEILYRLASEDYYDSALGPVESTEIVQFVTRWGHCKGEDTTTTPVIRALFSIVVARVRRHDDSWFILASEELAVPESALRSHAAHGDSLSLVILIHIIRQQFIYLRTPSWPYWGIPSALKSASNFDVQNTSPELQHEFCALWNQMVRAAPDQYNLRVTWYILNSLRGVYNALHQGTDSAPTALLLCNTPSHILDETAPTIFPRTLQQHDNTPAIASLTIPNASSSSVPSPSHVDENLTVPPLDNSHHTQQPVDISLASLDPSNSCAIQDIVASGIDPTPQDPTSPPRSSTSPPNPIFLQGKADLLTPSDSPNLPSSASGLVLDSIRLTGPSLPKLTQYSI